MPSIDHYNFQFIGLNLSVNKMQSLCHSSKAMNKQEEDVHNHCSQCCQSNLIANSFDGAVIEEKRAQRIQANFFGTELLV